MFLRAHEFVVVTSTTRVFFLCIFIKFLISFLGHSNVELGVPSGMTKSAAESDKNLTTQIVAAKFKNDIGSVEVSGEKVWKSFDFSDTSRSDYNMEKVNFPENTLPYVNQAHLTIEKNKKIYYCDYYIIGQIVEEPNLP